MISGMTTDHYLFFVMLFMQHWGFPLYQGDVLIPIKKASQALLLFFFLKFSFYWCQDSIKPISVFLNLPPGQEASLSGGWI